MDFLIENLDEVIHRHSIVAIKDTYNEFSNRFLLTYRSDWECWMFFSFPTAETDNEISIKQRLSNMLKVSTGGMSLRYITDRIQPKYSESDHVNKVYQHSLYLCGIVEFPDILKTDEFELDGTRYKWMTIEDMKRDAIIMEKNKDVVAFVSEKIG